MRFPRLFRRTGGAMPPYPPAPGDAIIVQFPAPPDPLDATAAELQAAAGTPGFDAKAREYIDQLPEAEQPAALRAYEQLRREQGERS